MTLNEKQLEAVNHIDGPCLVVAGAGSGKTRVLTERIVNLINNNISPTNILAITFTNKAAKEMRNRVENSLGSVADSIFIGTFHSFGVKVLRENYESAGLQRNITILDRDDLKSLVKKILKELGTNSDDYDARTIVNKISYCKNEGLSPDEYAKLFLNEIDQVISKVYKRYNELLMENNSVDFDDLLIKPVELFKKNKDILDHYQEHYKYILVDEYQDTNPIQYELCKLLSVKYRNLFVVGDSDQSIYAFRNADYKNVYKFEQDHKDAKVIMLEENYRSTKNILNAANNVIKNNSSRKEKNLWSKNDDGELIEYVRLEDEKSEADFVVKKINNLLSMGFRYKDFGVLYRTNSQARAVEEAFLMSGMPYKVIGSYFFYARKEIKDLISYLSLIYNKNDNVALERVINVPKRGIGLKSIEKLREKAVDMECSLFDAIDSGKELEFKNTILRLIEAEKDLSISELVECILNESGILSDYENEKTLEADIKIDNLNDFKSIAVNFEKNDGYDLGEFLETISLVSDSGLYKEIDDAVNIMTLHSAKGLEFEIVFMVGMEEGLFPHIRSFENLDELEEERRICYVGITRAKKKLFFTNAKRRLLFGKTTLNPESRFIFEIDSEYIKTDEITKTFNTNIKIKDMYEEKEETYKVGDSVKHTAFGEGVIVGLSGGVATIAFKYGIGIKQIATNHKNLMKICN